MNYGSEIVIPLGQSPSAVASADFDGDGKRDLAWRLSQSVVLAFGDADGGFPRRGTVTTRTVGPTSLVAGDFNADGRADLALEALGGGVEVLLNQSDGGFASLLAGAADGGPDAGPATRLISMPFVDGGPPELVYLQGLALASLRWTGSAFVQGSGAALPAGASSLGNLAAGDFNGDGKVDVAVSGAGQSATTATVYFWAGNGDGTFQGPIAYGVASSGVPMPAAAGEFKVGAADELVLGGNPLFTLPFDGGFDAGVSSFSSFQCAHLVAADLDGEEYPGLLGYGCGSFEPVVPAFSQGDGTFYIGGSSLVFRPASTVVGALAEDFNADGIPDVATANQGSNDGSFFLGERFTCGAPPTVPCPTTATNPCFPGGRLVCCASGGCLLSTGSCAQGVASVPPTACPLGTLQCADQTCCPNGFACQNPGCAFQRPNPFPAPCDGGVCPIGTSCQQGTCCPADHPVGCGANCCLPGVACNAGQCGCPSGEQACGTQCCGSGQQCVNGTCTGPCPDPNFPLVCGTACCAAGHTCSAQACQCTQDHPVPCGHDCCLPGASCSSGQCGCPPGRTECGTLCCPSGQACQAGACVGPTPDSGPPSGSCGNGGQWGSVNFCIQNGTSGSCGCNNASTEVCVTPAFWQQNGFVGAWPAQCAPKGTACVGQDGVTPTAYCCPGLTCYGIGGPACAPHPQGTCD